MTNYIDDSSSVEKECIVVEPRALDSHEPQLWPIMGSVNGVAAQYSARNWSFRRKLLISTGAIASFLVITMATSIYIASIPGIMQEFHIGKTLAIAPVTFYAMGFIVGPMCTSALSEEFGRQYIYKASLLLHLVFTVVAASARDFRTIAVGRAVSGLVGSPAATVFAGVLNDLWKMPEDKLAVPLFLLYGLGGAAAPEIGPVIGESIVASYGWRSTFWLTAILVGICLLAMSFVPETYEPEIRRKMLNLPRENWRKTLGPAFVRPFRMLIAEPIIFPTTLIVTMSQVVIFILYDGFPIVLQENYGFSTYQVGLAFLSLLLGTLLTAPTLAFLNRRKRPIVDTVPEDSLDGAMVAAIIFPTSLFWLAWSVRPTIHWTCPLFAGVLFGLGFALSQLTYPLYKNRVYGAELGTSALAIDVFMRYSFSGPFPLFTGPLIKSIGFEWIMTICALVMVTVMPVPWMLRKYGATLRGRSHFLRKPRTQINQAAMTSIDTPMAQEADQDQQRECIIKQRHLNQPCSLMNVSASSTAADKGDCTEREASHETKYPLVTDTNAFLQSSLT